MKILVLLILLPMLLLFPSCRAGESAVFSVATWNMYAFFDGRDDGTEFSEFRFSSGWSRSRYEERVRRTALFIAENLSDADLIILEEVESRDVLSDLLEAGLIREGYLYCGFADEGGNLGTGFISRIPPLSASVISVPGGRGMLWLRMNILGEEVDVVGVHLRSMLTGEGDGVRAEEVALLSSMMPFFSSSLVIAGDFNCDPRCINGEMESERLGGNAILSLTGDGNRARGGRLYSPFLDYENPLGGGTFRYGGRWEALDNILLSHTFFDGTGVEYAGTRIVKSVESMDSSGFPKAYDRKNGDGYSDHFPLISTFILVP